MKTLILVMALAGLLMSCSSTPPTKDHIAYAEVAKGINSGAGYKPRYEGGTETPVTVTGLAAPKAVADPSKMTAAELVSDYKVKTNSLSNEFRKCAKEFPLKGGGFPRELKFAWVINKNGTITDLRLVTAKNLTDDAQKCAEAKVRKLSFQPPKTGEKLDTVFEEKF